MQITLLNSVASSKSDLKSYVDNYKAKFSFLQNQTFSFREKNILDIYFRTDLDELIID